MNATATLDQEQLRTDYGRDGFVVVPRLFSPGEVDEVQRTFDDINDKERARGDEHRVADPTDPLHQFPRYVHPHRYNAVARHYMLHPGVAQCLRAIVGEEPVATQSMYYFKAPGARGQAMHQDNLYLLVEPGACLAAWTAIDRCDRENGCMMVVPGSHRGNIICQEKADMSVSFTPGTTRIPDGMKAIEVPMEAGDTLFFHGSLIHGSGPNRTKDRFRRSFIGHYAAGSLDRISKYYLPMVRMDGTDCEVAANTDGGACGADWEGALH